MKENKRCILIVDDEIKMTKALKDFFTACSYHVYTAYDGAEAIDVFYEKNNEIDLILLDVMMPKIDGYEVLEQLRNSGELVPIIMLTAKGEEYDQLKGLKNGADDYITKPFSLSLLQARIDNIFKRVFKIDNDGVSVGKINISTVKRTFHIDGKEIVLKRREFDLIHFLVVNQNQTFTREQLLDNVWGYSFDGDFRTVDTHIKQLRMKFGEFSSMIKTVHGVGYKFEVDDEN